MRQFLSPQSSPLTQATQLQATQSQTSPLPQSQRLARLQSARNQNRLESMLSVISASQTGNNTSNVACQPDLLTKTETGSKGFFAGKDKLLIESSSVGNNMRSSTVSMGFFARKKLEIQRKRRGTESDLSEDSGDIPILPMLDDMEMSERTSTKQKVIYSDLSDPQPGTSTSFTSTVIDQLTVNSLPSVFHSENTGNSSCSVESFGVENTESVSSVEGLLHTSSIDSSDVSRCEKCNQLVSAWDLPEHLDFHFAMDLQKAQDLSDRPPPKPVVADSGNTNKRKSSGDSSSKSGRPSKKSKLSKTNERSLDNFFKKST